MARLEYKHAVFAAKESAQVTNGGVKEYTIPTQVWIVTADDGTKVADVQKSTVEKQLAALNEAYATASDAAGLKWNFKVEGITKVSGPDMCDQGNEAKMKQKLRKGGANTLNLYITDLSACGLLGYSSWPWDLSKKGLVMDGVVIHYDTLPGGNYKPYNMGRTTIHEIGHWLGLYHTFQVRPHTLAAKANGYDALCAHACTLICAFPAAGGLSGVSMSKCSLTRQRMAHEQLAAASLGARSGLTPPPPCCCLHCCLLHCICVHRTAAVVLVMLLRTHPSVQHQQRAAQPPRTHAHSPAMTR
jgi:hypothetical protein